MADDIVERLRRAAVGLPQDDMNQTAADEIARLRAEVRSVRLNHLTTLGELQEARGHWRAASQGCTHLCMMCAAADAIEARDAEIERLRAEINYLANCLERTASSVSESLKAHDAWQEARRG